MRQITLFSAGLVLLFHGLLANAEVNLPTPDVAITVSVEEGKKVLIATVTLGGKPLEGVPVAFFVERSFGFISLGKDETISDGTAMAHFPEGLPGGPKGELRIVAEVAETFTYAAQRRVLTMEGGAKVAPGRPYPRALWAPRAPLPLIVTIVILLSIVWSTYIYVFVQLSKIRKGGKKSEIAS